MKYVSPLQIDFTRAILPRVVTTNGMTAAGRKIRNIARQTIPEDVRNERIHKCWVLNRT